MKRITARRLWYWRLVSTPLARWSGWGRYRVHVWLPVAVAFAVLVMIAFWR